MKIKSDNFNDLVGSAFEELTEEEMFLSQGGNIESRAAWTSSAQCIAAGAKSIAASTGWCSAGVIISTVVYSVMKC